MSRIGLMQITDSLSPGGLERMAVNLANALPADLYDSHLCTTRGEGPLEALVEERVGRLRLRRRGRLDLGALRRLTGYIRTKRIQVLHAHGSSIFFAVAAALFPPHPRVVWHDHFGRYDTEQRSVWLYRLLMARVDGVIAVTEPLAEWSRRHLRVRENRVWYVPNFVTESSSQSGPDPSLPGRPGFRIVCVANLRPEKDHPNLIEAMDEVARREPRVHLLLLGQALDAGYVKSIEEEITKRRLSAHVSWLGSRSDVAAILKVCDIAVLSSASEGLPLALIEYGLAGLPAVATRVGQCEEVLAGGRAGLLVPPGSAAELAMAILSLLESPERRGVLAAQLAQRVREHYSEKRAIERVCEVYESVLEKEPAPAAA